MKGIFVLVLLCLAIRESFANDTLECYQCSLVTSECTVDNATSVKCGTFPNLRCSKQVKKGSSDESKAIRKCVMFGIYGRVPCPDGFDCYFCDSNMCNTASAIKFTWVSLIGVFFTILYMY